MSSVARTPMHRGFDFFYGYYNGFVDYWTKEYTGYLDLQNGEMLETDPNCITPDLHNAYLMSWKTIDTINNHANFHKVSILLLHAFIRITLLILDYHSNRISPCFCTWPCN